LRGFAQSHPITGDIVGTTAGDLICEVALAIERGCDVEVIEITIHPNSTLGETIIYPSCVRALALLSDDTCQCPWSLQVKSETSETSQTSQKIIDNRLLVINTKLDKWIGKPEHDELLLDIEQYFIRPIEVEL